MRGKIAQLRYAAVSMLDSQSGHTQFDRREKNQNQKTKKFQYHTREQKFVYTDVQRFQKKKKIFPIITISLEDYQQKLQHPRTREMI